MRTLTLVPILMALAACGQADAPQAQAGAPAASATPAPVSPADGAPTQAAPATDAVAAPTWTPPPEPAAEPAATTPSPVPAPGADTAPATAAAPAPEPAAPVAAPVSEPVAAAAPAPASEPAPAAPAGPAAAADTPYQVVDGRIDANTVEGWKVYRGIGTCATCHGPVGQGGVGPALVDSLKEKITKELFVETVTNGRDGTMMKPFGENPVVMANLDNLYAYLKARADGVLGPENLIKYPLGKIE